MQDPKTTAREIVAGIREDQEWEGEELNTAEEGRSWKCRLGARQAGLLLQWTKSREEVPWSCIQATVSDANVVSLVYLGFSDTALKQIQKAEKKGRAADVEKNEVTRVLKMKDSKEAGELCVRVRHEQVRLYSRTLSDEERSRFAVTSCPACRAPINVSDNPRAPVVFCTNCGALRSTGEAPSDVIPNGYAVCEKCGFCDLIQTYERVTEMFITSSRSIETTCPACRGGATRLSFLISLLSACVLGVIALYAWEIAAIFYGLTIACSLVFLWNVVTVVKWMASPKGFAGLRGEALARARAKRWKEAAETFDRWLREHPDDLGAWFNRARCLAEAGLADEALRAVEESRRASGTMPLMVELELTIRRGLDGAPNDPQIPRLQKQRRALQFTGDA